MKQRMAISIFMISRNNITIVKWFERNYEQ